MGGFRGTKLIFRLGLAGTIVRSAVKVMYRASQLMINVEPFESLLKPWNLGSEWRIVRIIHSFAVLRLLAEPHQWSKG